MCLGFAYILSYNMPSERTQACIGTVSCYAMTSGRLADTRLWNPSPGLDLLDLRESPQRSLLDGCRRRQDIWCSRRMLILRSAGSGASQTLPGLGRVSLIVMFDIIWRSFIKKPWRLSVLEAVPTMVMGDAQTHPNAEKREKVFSNSRWHQA